MGSGSLAPRYVHERCGLADLRRGHGAPHLATSRLTSAGCVYVPRGLGMLLTVSIGLNRQEYARLLHQDLDVAINFDDSP